MMSLHHMTRKRRSDWSMVWCFDDRQRRCVDVCERTCFCEERQETKECSWDKRKRSSRKKGNNFTRKGAPRRTLFFLSLKDTSTGKARKKIFVRNGVFYFFRFRRKRKKKGWSPFCEKFVIFVCLKIFFPFSVFFF